MSCIRCSQIALRSVRARRSGLCANADGRPERRVQRRVRAGPRLAGDSGGVGSRPRRRPPTTCSSARPRLPLRALCAPPSPARWRRAPLARARRFAPGVLRCLPRAGGTLPSRAAAALRVVRHPCAGGAPLLPARLAVPTAHFLPYICFVSALCQSITAFCRPVDRNLQRISRITPPEQLPKFCGRFTPGDGLRTAHQYRGLSIKKYPCQE